MARARPGQFHFIRVDGIRSKESVEAKRENRDLRLRLAAYRRLNLYNATHYGN